MLTYLRVRNLALLEDVSADLGAGLNVLTGETGTGKSLLVGAIGLLLGARADSEAIRRGEDRAVVEAQLSPVSPGSIGRIEAAGLTHPGEEGVVVRREINRAGPNRVFVNGDLTSLAVLRGIVGQEVALHGQHEHLTLGSRDAQLELLDSLFVDAALRRRLAAAWDALRAADEALQTHRQRALHRDQRREEIDEILAALDAVRPDPDEAEGLRREEILLASVEERRRLAGEILDQLADEDDAATVRLARAAASARELAERDPDLDDLSARLDEARFAAEDAVQRVRRHADLEDADPARLEWIASRLSELQRLERRHATDVAGLCALAESLRAERAELEEGDAATLRLQTAREAAAKAYDTLACKVGTVRRSGARRLSRQVEQELPPLSLAGARFTVAVEAESATGTDAILAGGSARGYERVEFRFAADGDEPRSLARYASGGELSRLMLALSVAGGEAAAQGPASVIYDEIDTGTGGDVADRIGQRLQSLAGGQQVLCVTHQPQIAARAERHLRLEKTGGGTRVTVLEPADRVQELARMLGGGRASETARRHARALIRECKQGTPRRASRRPRQEARWA